MDLLQSVLDARDMVRSYAVFACVIPLVAISGLLVREWARCARGRR